MNQNEKSVEFDNPIGFRRMVVEFGDITAFHPSPSRMRAAKRTCARDSFGFGTRLQTDTHAWTWCGVAHLGRNAPDKDRRTRRPNTGRAHRSVPRSTASASTSSELLETAATKTAASAPGRPDSAVALTG